MCLATFCCCACAHAIDDGMPVYMRCDRTYCSEACRSEGYRQYVMECRAAALASGTAEPPKEPLKQVAATLPRRSSSGTLAAESDSKETSSDSKASSSVDSRPFETSAAGPAESSAQPTAPSQPGAAGPAAVAVWVASLGLRFFTSLTSPDALKQLSLSAEAHARYESAADCGTTPGSGGRSFGASAPCGGKRGHSWSAWLAARESSWRRLVPSL
mmetsp:Transcript_92945/g.259741  ORF Transcript_92945/g.259741 Transcript_92945/m.259741 type:complete len:215 (-) Transcript_92945:638-1282(-)